MWRILLAVAVAGIVGGALNSLLGATGLTLPRIVHANGSTIIMPGVVGNLIVGAVSALLSFSLYGPLAEAEILRGRSNATNTASASIGITLGMLAGAVLVGFSGGRWMTAEAERGLNHATAVVAAEMAQHEKVRPAPATAQSGSSASVLQSLRFGSPLQAFEQATRARQTIANDLSDSP